MWPLALCSHESRPDARVEKWTGGKGRRQMQRRPEKAVASAFGFLSMCIHRFFLHMHLSELTDFTILQMFMIVCRVHRAQTVSALCIFKTTMSNYHVYLFNV